MHGFTVLFRNLSHKFTVGLGIVAMVSLSLVSSVQAATGPAYLSVTTTPDGITLISPTCFTMVWGTCGVASWTSSDNEGIKPTTYTFPLTATAGGLNYILVRGNFLGCNLGMPGTVGNQCRVSVDRGVIGAIHATYRLVPPPAVANCAYGAPNLVLNPSFESVTGAGVFSGSTNPLDTWWYISTPAASKVPHWTRDNSNEPVVFNGGTISGVTQLAASGQRYVRMGFADFSTPSGLRGVVTPVPTNGTTYVISAMVESAQWPTSGVISMRLANSGTGAQSAVVYDTSAPESSLWTRLGGSVVATGYYNRVVIRYVQGGGAVRVDDVKVCRAAVSMHRSLNVKTAVTLTANEPAAYGQPVAFTALVTDHGGGIPTGNVEFLVNGKASASTALLNGRASVSIDSSTWTGRAHVIATYRGDLTHHSSSSRTIVVRIPPPASTGTTTTTSGSPPTTTTTSGSAGSPTTTTTPGSAGSPTTTTTTTSGSAGSPVG
jgi:hypothetical protein